MNKEHADLGRARHHQETEKEKAMQLHKSDKVRYTGILDDWGSLMPITLTDGEIIE